MRVKNGFFLAVILTMTSCTSLETSLKSAPVPQTRMYDSKEKSEANSAQLSILRDRSIAGSICYYAIYIDDKLVSRIANSENATFFLAPGDRKLQITRDKQGEGLCSSGDDETTKRINLGQNEKRFYRLSQNMAGSPDLKLLDVPPALANQH